MTDSGGPPPPGERQREGIKNLGLHNELGLSDSRAVMGRAYLKAMGLVISHASHTFGGRRIESPQGGTTAAPPPLEDLGLTSRGLRRLAIETGIVWLGKFSASSRQTCQKSYENLEKIDPDCAKSSPEASKIELGALQDAILKDI